MKTNSILRIFAALTIVLGFAMTTVGQQSANASVAGNANVAAQVTVTGNTPLEFGNVTPGVTKTVSSAGVVGPGLPGGTTETAGKFTITKGANTQVTLGFTLPSNLVDLSSNNLAINFVDYAGPTKCAKLSYTALTDVPFTPASGEVIANTGSTATYFASTEFYVFIGGTVVPITGQVAGAYTGTITLTATYN